MGLSMPPMIVPLEAAGAFAEAAMQGLRDSGILVGQGLVGNLVLQPSTIHLGPITITRDSVTYNGETVKDAGRVHAALLEVLSGRPLAAAATPTGIDLNKLEALARAATPGPWTWWTSNSVLRLTGADERDGGVLHAYARGSYGAISCSPANQAFIAATNPAAVLELIAIARAGQKADAAASANATVPATELDGEMLSTVLWLYRRLPLVYGRPPVVERPIKALAALVGIDVADMLAERGADPAEGGAQ